MSLRILEADITAHVTNVLMNIKHGVEAARNQGLIVELPEKVDFQIEVVTAAQSLVAEETRTTTDTDTLARTTTEGGKTTTATQSGATTQSTDVASGESGGDTVTTTYTYS